METAVAHHVWIPPTLSWGEPLSWGPCVRGWGPVFLWELLGAAPWCNLPLEGPKHMCVAGELIKHRFSDPTWKILTEKVEMSLITCVLTATEMRTMPALCGSPEATVSLDCTVRRPPRTPQLAGC